MQCARLTPHPRRPTSSSHVLAFFFFAGPKRCQKPPFDRHLFSLSSEGVHGSCGSCACCKTMNRRHKKPQHSPKEMSGHGRADELN